MIEFDMFVIGTGPAGVHAAVQAAKLGKRVGICERNKNVGGVSINIGTIPSKAFREAVLFLTGFQQRGLYGPAFTVKQDIDMADLVFRCQHVITRESETTLHQLLRNGIQLIEGEASFKDPHHLVINGHQEPQIIFAENVVIATGTSPANIFDVEIDGKAIFTPDNLLEMKQIPRTMTIVGGGVIGLEYASIFGALGVDVTVVDKRPKLLDFMDVEIVESLMYHMRSNKCVFRLGEEVNKVEVEVAGKVITTLESGKKIMSDSVLFSAGRIGSTARLNLEAANLHSSERGFIEVNEHFQTTQPHIYAVGDIIGLPSLASTAMEQGRIATCSAYDIEHQPMPDLIPYGIYSVPEISTVGKNEQILTDEQVPYEVGIARYKEIARSAIYGDDTGLLKLIFHRETREILGVHIIGAAATELIHIGQAVIALGGTIDYFVNGVFNYPTFAECYKVAALNGFNKVGASPQRV